MMAGKFIKTRKKFSHREIKGNVQLQSDVGTNQNREEHLLSIEATFLKSSHREIICHPNIMPIYKKPRWQKYK